MLFRLIWAVLALLVADTAAQLDPILQAWDDYKNMHSKQYANPIVAAARLLNFRANNAKFVTHNLLYSTGLASYKQGNTYFADMTTAEVKQRMCGYKASGLNRTAEYNVWTKPTTAPTYKNWPEENVFSAVYEQGPCCASYALASTSAMASLADRLGHMNHSLSAQPILDCMIFGCNGATSAAAFDFIFNNYGLPITDNYPYVGNKGTCQQLDAGLVNLDSYTKLYDEEEIKLFLSLYPAVTVAICVDDTFPFYVEGIYSSMFCNCPPNHVLHVVGYGSDGPNKDYWIVKNSWGISWGKDGYGKIARGSNMCKFTEDAIGVPTPV